MSGARILALAAFLFWTAFCLYAAATGLLNLFPPTGDEAFTERILRLGIRLTLWAFIWLIPVLAGIALTLLLGRKERRPQSPSDTNASKQ